jgi:hypothetical protein
LDIFDILDNWEKIYILEKVWNIFGYRIMFQTASFLSWPGIAQIIEQDIKNKIPSRPKTNT